MMKRAHPATWAPGAVVPGTVYRVIRPLGSGGMGEVYEAEHELLGVRRAIKVLSRRLVDRPDLAERLRIEARALARLRHPNLVEVNDLGVSSDGRVFYAMELLVGKTLREMLNEKRRFKVDQAVHVTAQLLDALGAAHERGMVHRDVKPENVFLLENGAVKLLDFGVAKAVHGADTSGNGLTAAGAAVGTPRYMAPEQAEGKPVDARTDLYAVGVVLWEMLVGRAPFADLDAIPAAVAVVTKGVPPLEAQGVDVPKSIAAAVNRATSRNREERFPTAAAFSAELRLAEARVSLVGTERPTVRYEHGRTSLVPVLAFGEGGEMGSATEPDPVSAVISADTEPHDTFLAASIDDDRRNRPTPTSIPRASAPSLPSATPAAAIAPQAPPSSRPLSPVVFVAIPLTAFASIALTLVVLRSSAPAPVPAAPSAPPIASVPQATPAAPAPSPTTSAVAAAPTVDRPSPPSSAPAASPASRSSPPPTKKPAVPTPAPKPPAARGLPGSGLLRANLEGSF